MSWALALVSGVAQLDLEWLNSAAPRGVRIPLHPAPSTRRNAACGWLRIVYRWLFVASFASSKPDSAAPNKRVRIDLTNPAITEEPQVRILVVGTSGAGKTTIAR